MPLLHKGQRVFVFAAFEPQNQKLINQFLVFLIPQIYQCHIFFLLRYDNIRFIMNDLTCKVVLQIIKPKSIIIKLRLHLLLYIHHCLPINLTLLNIVISPRSSTQKWINKLLHSLFLHLSIQNLRLYRKGPPDFHLPPFCYGVAAVAAVAEFEEGAGAEHDGAEAEVDGAGFPDAVGDFAFEPRITLTKHRLYQNFLRNKRHTPHLRLSPHMHKDFLIPSDAEIIPFSDELQVFFAAGAVHFSGF